MGEGQGTQEEIFEDIGTNMVSPLGACQPALSGVTFRIRPLPECDPTRDTERMCSCMFMCGAWEMYPGCTLRNAVDGFNCTLFAYGQTGSAAFALSSVAICTVKRAVSAHVWKG